MDVQAVKEKLLTLQWQGVPLSSMKTLKVTLLPDQRLALSLPFPIAMISPEWIAEVENALGCEVVLSQVIPTFAVQASLKPLEGISNVIAIASGKGGVGKSTTAVNVALALQQQGARVGILDADIYGPSQPLMLGGVEAPHTQDQKTIEPVMKFGLQTMSIGYLLQGDSQPVIWRGPMVSTALKQLLRDTRWHDLDYLIIDLPPGTGDIQLTLVQKIPLSGAVIVTTPQDVALIDAKKAHKMFEKLSIPVLGIVENMSHYHCPQCGHLDAIFGTGGAEKMQIEFQVPLLGQVPLDTHIRLALDAGQPSVFADPGSKITACYHAIAHRLAAELARRPKSYARELNVVVENKERET